MPEEWMLKNNIENNNLIGPKRLKNIKIAISDYISG